MTGYQQGTVQACNTFGRGRCSVRRRARGIDRHGRASDLGHASVFAFWRPESSVDARDKPGHDEKRSASCLRIDETKQFIPLNIAVLTISDTRSLADDKSGTTLAERLTAAGHVLAAREIIVDDVDAIRIIIRRWIADPGIDAIITTGGTGFTGRDVTPEAIEPLFEKRMDGFSIAFHMLSHAKIGASTIQSRATAGVAGATYIFCLPGSPGACRDGWDGILAPQLDYRTRPCNFVEIMPRLDEHLRRPKAQGRVGLVIPRRVRRLSDRSVRGATARLRLPGPMP